MSRYNIGSDTFYFQSIVELVKLHKIGAFSFPEDVDVVTGGFPCQDFSVAGKRLGFESKKCMMERFEKQRRPQKKQEENCIIG